ncbi:hypothetical protein BOX15_Mlig009240g1 [Macrostomum lignano]|uniref:RGS domain-containing protein n=1 Tax=Macrostomum lignano TaxID=282301 RepID=A0A267H799_9PLAT|nr:hypothetical protein BOX15_Mlig009240g1 [Macrostomum lignano]
MVHRCKVNSHSGSSSSGSTGAGSSGSLGGGILKHSNYQHHHHQNMTQSNNNVTLSPGHHSPSTSSTRSTGSPAAGLSGASSSSAASVSAVASSSTSSTSLAGPSVTFAAGVAGGSSSAGSSSRRQRILHHQPHHQHQLERLQHPNTYLWTKLERLLERMQNEDSGISVRTVKSFMSSRPSCFTGAEMCSWLQANADADDAQEASHLATMLATHGYIIPVEGHQLAVRNDSSYYRFQTPCLWPSKSPERLDNTDYAVYLCKRTLLNKQRLELADYEAENLARLQRLLSHKWELIYLQAEAEAKVDRKCDRLERRVLESQERGFWILYRPPPGTVSSTELNMRKLCRAKRPKKPSQRPANFPIPSGRVSPVEACESDMHADKLRAALARCRVRISKSAECFTAHCSQWLEFDAFLGGGLPESCPNPWATDSLEFWESERRTHDIPARRVKRWAFDMQELLRDPAGRIEFERWLEKEFSRENLSFWEACQELRRIPLSQVGAELQRIYSNFLGPDAQEPVNLAGHVAERVRRRMEGRLSDRFAFEEAEENIYQLMRTDSYSRFVHSDYYRDLLAGCKKKSKKRFPSDVRKNLAATASSGGAGPSSDPNSGGCPGDSDIAAAATGAVATTSSSGGSCGGGGGGSTN